MSSEFSSQGSGSQGLRIATPQHRLGGYFLDAILLLLTCGIGWMIWSLVIWSDGLTPAKQILKMRVYSKSTFKPATWGNMAIRQFLLPLAPSMLVFIFAALLGASNSLFYDPFCDPYFDTCSDYSSGIGVTVSLLYLGLFIVQIVDAIWLLTNPERKRLVDILSKTVVVNEARN